MGAHEESICKNIPFICVALYKEGVTNHCLDQINILYPDSTIYIICPRDDNIKFKLLELNNIVVIDEDTFIEGFNKQDFLTLINFYLTKKKACNGTWYWQQFLKLLCYKNNSIPEQYVIIDSDIIILNKIEFFACNKAVFNKILSPSVGGWGTKEMTAFIKKFVGLDRVKQGYISEYMVFEKKYIKEMLNIFGKTTHDIISNCLQALREDKYNLSEYLWYANFMFKNYPEKVTTHTICHLRTGHYYYGHSIRKCDIAIFKKIWKLDSFCIEPWETRFFYFSFMHRFISYIRYKFNYYGYLPFSVVSKKDPSWVYDLRYPLIHKIYFRYSLIHKPYRIIIKVCKFFKNIYNKFCNKLL